MQVCMHVYACMCADERAFYPIIVSTSLKPLLETLAASRSVELSSVDHGLHVTLSEVLHSLRLRVLRGAHVRLRVSAVREYTLVFFARPVLIRERDIEPIEGGLCSALCELRGHDELGQGGAAVPCFRRLKSNTHGCRGWGQVERVCTRQGRLLLWNRV